LKHDDVVRPVGSGRRGCRGWAGVLAGQSGLDAEADDRPDEASALPVDDDEDDEASWAGTRALDNSGAAAKAAMAAARATAGIRVRMTRTFRSKPRL